VEISPAAPGITAGLSDPSDIGPGTLSTIFRPGRPREARPLRIRSGGVDIKQGFRPN